jgi:hypothetical protein
MEVPMYQSRVSTLAAAAVIAAFAAATPARASALYFEKVAVKTQSEATCLRFAGDTLRSQGYSNMHSSGSEAAGSKQGVYVAITCVGRGSQPAIAVVMAMAADFDAAKHLGHAAADHVKGIVCFDSPC